MFDDSKPLWRTKTFWINLIGGAATVLGWAVDVLPPQYSAIALAIANVLNRLVTKEPARLL